MKVADKHVHASNNGIRSLLELIIPLRVTSEMGLFGEKR
jgi:hypothetical protein